MAALFILYAILSVAGVVLFKLGTQTPIEFALNSSLIRFQIGWISIAGLCCYVVSFLMYMFLIAKTNLSTLVPFATAGIYVLTMCASVIVFKEKLSWIHIGGSLLIIAGVLLISYKKQ